MFRPDNDLLTYMYILLTTLVCINMLFWLTVKPCLLIRMSVQLWISNTRGFWTKFLHHEIFQTSNKI